MTCFSCQLKANLKDVLTHLQMPPEADQPSVGGTQDPTFAACSASFRYDTLEGFWSPRSWLKVANVTDKVSDLLSLPLVSGIRELSLARKL